MKRILTALFAIVLLTQLACTAAPAKKNKIGYFTITYETKDSFVLKAKLFYPAEKKAEYPLVVLLHSIGCSGDYWSGLQSKFINAGAAVLVMDLRGHGQSIYDTNFKIKSWRYFTDKVYAKYPDDVSQLLKYVVTNYKNVSPQKYAIVGADIGANTAILTSEKMFAKPKSLVLISPSRTFKGLYTPIVFTNIGTMPVLTAVSKKDNFSYNEALALKKFAQGKYDLKVYPNGGAGMLMLKVNPTMSSDIVNWVMPILK